jgi:hypothetical protein
MPISAERMKLYPGGSITSPEWLAIRGRILKRAGNRCELCGVANGQLGGRAPDGRWMPARPLGEKMLSLEWPQPGTYAWCGGVGQERRYLRIVRIVLTIMHMDHDPGHNTDDNLKAGCQRCHLNYDAKFHAQNAAATRRAAMGCDDLFERKRP